ncbi:MAG: hypothetical protein ACI9DF_003760 [Verrucomicrobiales bacterium]
MTAHLALERQQTSELNRKMAMTGEYDSSWDLADSEDGTLPGNNDAFGKIYSEWEKRAWKSWLRNNLTFPFLVKRVEDAYFTDIAKSEPFRLGHAMKAIDIEMEDDNHGIILKVREGRRVGHVPLCDVQVTTRENENFWPVREYVVWFANH